MKSQIITSPPEIKPLTFPLLAQCIESGDKSNINMVVLFRSNISGVILVSNSPNNKVGDYKNWSDITNGCWKILPPGTQIVLTQE